jgi:hypothetical protein
MDAEVAVEGEAEAEEEEVAVEDEGEVVGGTSRLKDEGVATAVAKSTTMSLGK